MGYELLLGDCLDVLPTLPAGSIHCVVTSPPYFGHRSYGIGTENGEIGLESTVSEYVQKMVAVFREVRRVLRDDGTVWLNLGDSYAGSWGNYGGQNRGNGSQREITNGSQAHQKAYDGLESWRPPTTNPGDGLKPKDLIGIPWRVAFALQADGWWLRSDIIWHKPNPMPESVTDRPTKSHEYLFLLTKSERYFYDAEAIKEATTYSVPDERKPSGDYSKDSGRNDGGLHRSGGFVTSASRNKRSVWTVATKPYREAHFATYPVGLVEPCIMAGTSAHGCCAACGAPWVRVVERTAMEMRPGPSRDARTENGKLRTQVNGTMTKPPTSETLGWEPSCGCGADVVPCTVLDPFNGAGTTGVAAIGLGRQYIGIELNPDYIKLAERRLNATQPALLAV